LRRGECHISEILCVQRAECSARRGFTR
jgi:hypothetical protein